jgi:hypothetical protein
MISRRNRSAHVAPLLQRQTNDQVAAGRIRVKATTDVCLLLSRQGLAFRGHDEGVLSANRGNFLEMLDLLSEHSPALHSARQAAPGNATYESPSVQKQVCASAATTVRRRIVAEFGQSFFCILADEARCAATKEWMSLIIRFVDAQGAIKERLLDIVHVEDTCSETLFQHVKALLVKHGLAIDKVS